MMILVDIIPRASFSHAFTRQILLLCTGFKAKTPYTKTETFLCWGQLKRSQHSLALCLDEMNNIGLSLLNACGCAPCRCRACLDRLFSPILNMWFVDCMRLCDTHALCILFKSTANLTFHISIPLKWMRDVKLTDHYDSRMWNVCSKERQRWCLYLCM